MHHIDRDPRNNGPSNLIPLCPNCHLTDQHDPTAPVHPEKLGLFRRHKDPLILSHQFEPLFRRTRFLWEPDSYPTLDLLDAAASDLTAFVAALEMWSYYHPKIKALVDRELLFPTEFGTPDAELERREAESLTAYRLHLGNQRMAIESLLVELLRYQPWPTTTRRQGNQ